MKHLNLYEGFLKVFNENKKEKKDLKWITKNIENPGSLHKKLGVSKEEKIPMETINAKIDELHKKREESGDKLDKKESKFLRRLQLAKKMKSF